VLRRAWTRSTVAGCLLCLALIEMVARYLYLQRLSGSVEISYHALPFRSDGLMVGSAIAFIIASPLARWLARPPMAALVKSGAVVGALIFPVVLWGEPTLLTEQWAYVPLTVGAPGLY